VQKAMQGRLRTFVLDNDGIQQPLQLLAAC
jgi:hypothetical protein